MSEGSVLISWFGSLSTRRLGILVLVAGLELRVVLGLFYTYPIEDNYWILGSTNLTAGEGLYGVPGYYYLPVWGYFLAVMTAVANFLGIPYGHYYDDIGTSLKDCDIITPSVEYSLMVLAVLIIFDILVAHLIFRIGCRVTGDERKAVIMAAIWFLCPLTIAISSIRLMFENVEIFFLLASVLMLMDRKPFPAGLLMGACFLSKQFGLFAAIILLGYSYAQTRDIRYSLKCVAGTAVSVLILMAPVILNGDLETSMHWLTSRVDAGTSASTFNLTIVLTPLIVLLTAAMGFKVARDGIQDFRALSLFMLLPVALMFILPGNVQYYLFLLPFMVFAFSKEMYIPYVSMSLLAVMSLLVVINMCSMIYVDSGLPGAGIIDGIADFFEPFEDHSHLYELLKSITGALVAIATVLILLKPRFSNEACRRHRGSGSGRGHADRYGPGLWSECLQMRSGGLER